MLEIGGKGEEDEEITELKVSIALGCPDESCPRFPGSQFIPRV